MQRMENERKISIAKFLSSQKGSPSQKIDATIGYSLKLICSLLFMDGGTLSTASFLFFLSRVNFLFY